MLPPLCAFGHVASYAELLEAFHGQTSAILPFRHSTGGSVNWLRSNVFICAHLDDEERLAARVGGVLDCTTVLRRHGLLEGVDDDDGCLHLRLRKNDGRASARRRKEARAIRTHWRDPHWNVPSLEATRRAVRRSGPGGSTPLTRLELPLKEALRTAVSTCLSSEVARAVIDRVAVPGAGLQPSLDIEELTEVISLAPRHVRVRLRRGGLPEELDASLRALERGNIFDDW